MAEENFAQFSFHRDTIKCLLEGINGIQGIGSTDTLGGVLQCSDIIFQIGIVYELKGEVTIWLAHTIHAEGQRASFLSWPLVSSKCLEASQKVCYRVSALLRMALSAASYFVCGPCGLLISMIIK